jgi:hypothetical protein
MKVFFLPADTNAAALDFIESIPYQEMDIATAVRQLTAVETTDRPASDDGNATTCSHKSEKARCFFSQTAECYPAVSGSSPETESPCFRAVSRSFALARSPNAAGERLPLPSISWKSCRRPRFRLKVSRDQARAFIKAQVSPGPLEHYYYTIPKSDQKQDMDKQPCHPGRQSAQMQKV